MKNKLYLYPVVKLYQLLMAACLRLVNTPEHSWYIIFIAEST